MKPEITILMPQGRLDAAGVRPLETELAEHLAADRIHLLVDLSQVSYVSSVGLRMFLTTLRKARRKGGMLKLCNLNERVMVVFKLAGFDRVLSILPTREEAEKSFVNRSK